MSPELRAELEAAVGGMNPGLPLSIEERGDHCGDDALAAIRDYARSSPEAFAWGTP